MLSKYALVILYGYNAYDYSKDRGIHQTYVDDLESPKYIEMATNIQYWKKSLRAPGQDITWCQVYGIDPTTKVTTMLLEYMPPEAQKKYLNPEAKTKSKVSVKLAHLMNDDVPAAWPSLFNTTTAVTSQLTSPQF